MLTTTERKQALDHCRTLQNTIANWVIKTFGDKVLRSRHERMMRIMEEAFELAQVENIHQEELTKLMHRTYSRPVGEMRQEIGGLAVCIYAFCANANISFSECLLQEVNRILSLDPEKFRAKMKEKIADGVSEESIHG